MTFLLTAHTDRIVRESLISILGEKNRDSHFSENRAALSFMLISNVRSDLLISSRTTQSSSVQSSFSSRSQSQSQSSRGGGGVAFDDSDDEEVRAFSLCMFLGLQLTIIFIIN